MKAFLIIVSICLLSFVSGAKTVYSPFNLTVVDRFDNKGIPNVRVELYSSGKKSRHLKTLFTNESGVVQFDSLVKGNYRYTMALNDYIERNEYFTMYGDWSLETTKELDLTDSRKAQIILPYLITSSDIASLKNQTEVCLDSLKHQDLLYSKGYEKFKKDLDSLTHYPQSAIELGIQGKVFVIFIVDEHGDVIKVGLAEKAEPSLALEAMLIVLLFDRFEPRLCNGKPVKAIYNVPINFSLE